MVKRYYHIVMCAKGSSTPHQYAAGAAMVYRTFPNGSKTLLKSLRIPLGYTPQDAAEYITLIRALRALHNHFAEEKSVPKRAVLRVFSNGDLVPKQMAGSYKVKSKHLRVLHAIASGLAAAFGEVRYEQSKEAAGGRLEDVKAITRQTVGPLVDAPGIPCEPYIDYFPNLVLISEVWIDGTKVNASNDMHDGQEDGCHILVDAKFLASLPSYGPKVMRDKLKDPAPFNTLRGPGFDAHVLGTMQVEFAFDFIKARRNRNAPKNKRTFEVHVVDSLPVPMHLSTKHDEVQDSDMPDEVEYPHRFRLEPYHFDEAYHVHDYWLDFDKYQCGFDPTPIDVEDVQSL